MSDITNDGKNLDENGLDKDNKYYEERKKSTEEKTYVSDYSGAFARIRNEEQEKLLQAQRDNNYWNVLDSEVERIQADNDKDGKVSYEEYSEFIIAQENTKSETMLAKNKFDYETNHVYKLDTTVLIGIGVICVTAIIITFLARRKPTP
jgi:hypothetical protein